MLTDNEIQRFRITVYGYFDAHGRDLPWRRTTDPYHILVSEIMLQQTQVNRVEVKFVEFTERFPDIQSLDAAPLKDVLETWQGLGYNRRALALKNAAHMIVEEYGGEVPRTAEDLTTLPGIGHATAAAICAYAFNEPVVYIETNIRTVFIHTFFDDSTTVSDKNILPLVERTLDRDNPRRWYSALMDYGVMLKAKHGNPGKRSAHYTKQGAFHGSDRQVRGALLKLLVAEGPSSGSNAADKLGFDPERVARILNNLEREAFVTEHDGVFSIRDESSEG